MMKRPFIVLKEIIAIIFFIIGLSITMFFTKLIKPVGTKTPIINLIGNPE